MTTTKEQIRLIEAEDVAIDLLNRLEPACEGIEIAGSIRRQKAWVSDIELVAIPKMETVSTDLFGKVVTQRDLLHDVCDVLKQGGVLADRPDKTGRHAWGRKYKRMIYRGIPVDLFMATPENWGVIYMLRTGTAEFTRKMVTTRSFGGYMPFGMNLSDGRLWVRGKPVDTTSEQDVFDWLDLPWVEPEERR